MQLLVLRRVMVSARARGMPEITNHGKLFFSIKTIGSRSVTGAAVSVRTGVTCSSSFSIAGQIIRLKSGRRTEHLVAIDVNPLPMTGHGFFFVRCHDCSAPRRQT